MSFYKFFVVFLFCLGCLSLHAQKPTWIGTTPKELNYTYKFIVIKSYGNSLESARMDAVDRLTDNQQLVEGVRVTRNTRELTDIKKAKINNAPLQSEKQTRVFIDLTIDGEKYDLQANRIDEYMEMDRGKVILYTLFQVATCKDPVFDNVYLTERYGFTPTIMSLIPGVGQMYKGCYVKGGCILGAEILSVLGVILCENQRADYANKIIEQPKFAKEYNTKANNWSTARNVSVGIAGAIYLYNLIDAFVSPGARRVVVETKGVPSVHPVARDDFKGVSLVWRF